MRTHTNPKGRGKRTLDQQSSGKNNRKSNQSSSTSFNSSNNNDQQFQSSISRSLPIKIPPNNDSNFYNYSSALSHQPQLQPQPHPLTYQNSPIPQTQTQPQPHPSSYPLPLTSNFDPSSFPPYQSNHFPSNEMNALATAAANQLYELEKSEALRRAEYEFHHRQLKSGINSNIPSTHTSSSSSPNNTPYQNHFQYQPQFQNFYAPTSATSTNANQPVTTNSSNRFQSNLSFLQPPTLSNRTDNDHFMKCQHQDSTAISLNDDIGCDHDDCRQLQNKRLKFNNKKVMSNNYYPTPTFQKSLSSDHLYTRSHSVNGVEPPHLRSHKHSYQPYPYPSSTEQSQTVSPVSSAESDFSDPEDAHRIMNRPPPQLGFHPVVPGGVEFTPSSSPVLGPLRTLSLFPNQFPSHFNLNSKSNTPNTSAHNSPNVSRASSRASSPVHFTNFRLPPLTSTTTTTVNTNGNEMGFNQPPPNLPMDNRNKIEEILRSPPEPVHPSPSSVSSSSTTPMQSAIRSAPTSTNPSPPTSPGKLPHSFISMTPLHNNISPK